MVMKTNAGYGDKGNMVKQAVGLFATHTARNTTMSRLTGKMPAGTAGAEATIRNQTSAHMPIVRSQDLGKGTGDEITFVVEDHGRGIPDEYLQAVFERFESRNNGSRRRGPGLGLSIVKSFVELHGGVVEISSEVGTGTKVTCHLPLAPALAHAAE